MYNTSINMYKSIAKVHTQLIETCRKFLIHYMHTCTTTFISGKFKGVTREAVAPSPRCHIREYKNYV